jgi:hypothetical protein
MDPVSLPVTYLSYPLWPGLVTYCPLVGVSPPGQVTVEWRLH